jgi:hypothetical protein
MCSIRGFIYVFVCIFLIAPISALAQTSGVAESGVEWKTQNAPPTPEKEFIVEFNLLPAMKEINKDQISALQTTLWERVATYAVLTALVVAVLLLLFRNWQLSKKLVRKDGLLLDEYQKLFLQELQKQIGPLREDLAALRRRYAPREGGGGAPPQGGGGTGMSVVKDKDTKQKQPEKPQGRSEDKSKSSDKDLDTGRSDNSVCHEPSVSDPRGTGSIDRKRATEDVPALLTPRTRRGATPIKEALSPANAS